MGGRGDERRGQQLAEIMWENYTAGYQPSAFPTRTYQMPLLVEGVRTEKHQQVNLVGGGLIEKGWLSACRSTLQFTAAPPLG